MSRSVFGTNIIKKMFPRKFYKSKFLENPRVTRYVEKKLFEDDNIVCLPKDNVIQLNKDVSGGSENMVAPSKVVEHFIEKASYHFLMNFCICRDAVGCNDFHRDWGCLFLGEAAKGINPKLGSTVTKDEALDHARRCRDEGLVHFVGRSKLDTVWLKIGPGDRLFTICSCCPCCCITRGVPYSPKVLAEKISKMPGVNVTVNDNCNGCEACVEACFTHSIKVADGRAGIDEECRGCGRCAHVCPNDAIDVLIDNELYVQKTIEKLSESFDVL